jgi:hypothetical protein
MPLGPYRGWAPIADSPFDTKPYTPFVMEYGQSTSGAVGEARWRTVIPMVVFHSEQKNRALSIRTRSGAAVRIRFMKNTGAHADFHWNCAIIRRRAAVSPGRE